MTVTEVEVVLKPAALFTQASQLYFCTQELNFSVWDKQPLSLTQWLEGLKDNFVSFPLLCNYHNPKTSLSE